MGQIKINTDALTQCAQTMATAESVLLEGVSTMNLLSNSLEITSGITASIEVAMSSLKKTMQSQEKMLEQYQSYLIQVNDKFVSTDTNLKMQTTTLEYRMSQIISAALGDLTVGTIALWDTWSDIDLLNDMMSFLPINVEPLIFITSRDGSAEDFLATGSIGSSDGEIDIDEFLNIFDRYIPDSVTDEYGQLLGYVWNWVDENAPTVGVVLGGIGSAAVGLGSFLTSFSPSALGITSLELPEEEQIHTSIYEAAYSNSNTDASLQIGTFDFTGDSVQAYGVDASYSEENTLLPGVSVTTDVDLVLGELDMGYYVDENSLKAEVDISVAEFNFDNTFETPLGDATLGADLDFLTAESTVAYAVGDGDYYATVKAGASVVEVSGSIEGDVGSLGVTGQVGVGVSFSAGIVDGELKLSLGAALGLGAKVDVSLDYGAAAEGIVDAAIAVADTASDIADAASDLASSAIDTAGDILDDAGDAISGFFSWW